MEQQEPKIVCFACKFSWGYLEEESALISQAKNLVPIICSGKLDAEYVVDAFVNGADGVLILGCPQEECHFQDGNLEAKKRIALLKSVLASYGIEPERIKLVLSSDPDGSSIPGLVTEMSEQVKKIQSGQMVKG